MSKENLKNKGITLIALIITIIVMLILTGVTLSITLGDNGLVNKAKEATTQTQVAMDRELLLSAVVGAIGNDGKVNLSAIVLPEGFTGSNGTYTSKNGNVFTVSENGEILYTGDSDSEDEIESVDLSGKYYFYPDDESFYFEIIDDNTSVVVDSGVETVMQTVINHNNKTITLAWENEFFDNKTNEMATETLTMVINYELVIENDEVVNIILTDFDGIGIVFQNEQGFKYDLDGIYISGNGNGIITFLSGNSLYTDEWTGGSSSNDEYLYAKVNEHYFEFSDGYGMDFEVSEDKNTITINGTTYTKQAN